MKRLAIKGHPTRGNEIIEIFEMLGGKNIFDCSCHCIYNFYYINEFTKGIQFDKIGLENINDFTFFTIKEFINKFPYKIGDKVNVYDYESEVRIDDMKWDGYEIQYQVFTDETEWYSAAELNELKPYKQNINMENKEIIPTLDGKKLGGGYISYVIPEGYTYDGFNSLGEIMLKPNKIQYPKNYEECCDVLRMPKDESYIDIDVPLSYNKVLTVFTQLLICRDAYWKIFGEEMKLGKPWEPDFNDNNDKHFICYVRDEVWMSYIKDCNKVLVFPTEEMRNIFYENFKKEIEICKKLI